MTFVYICIPVHDEERTIGPVLWKIRETMAEYGRDYEVLVVDDASTDRTSEVLARYARVLPLTVHRCESRSGYAAALETAVREAVRRSEYPKRDAVVTLQGDFTEDPGFIPELVKRIEGGADVVTSASAQDTRGAPGGLRLARRAFEWLARRRDWPEALANPASGFRAYRVISLRKAIDEAGETPLMDRDGWLADLALLRAVVPHARRLEEADAPTRHGRLQRPSRFDLKASVRQVMGVVGSGTARSAASETWKSVVHAPAERARGNGSNGRRRGNGARTSTGTGRSRRPEGERRPRARPRAEDAEG
ncbi:MAG TPA: glycosyltransferase family 2 protein, partial [Longimicrobiales bacterium]|nr:glycosyltransferase family 2 protein [Longimicrobiales bacterium]